MVDILTKAQRSALMARVRGENTTPERTVRRFLHRHGFRFRLHPRNLPGRPDIVLPKFRTVIFVHGCFWHRHKGCVKTTTPGTRKAFWQSKFKANVERDRRKAAELAERGWKVLVVWECQVTAARLRNLSSRLKKINAVSKGSR